LRRNDFGAGLTNGGSDDGGFDEFRLYCPNCRRNSGNLSPQHIDHRPELRVLRSNLLIGRTSIGRHPTMINRKPRKINQTRRTTPDELREKDHPIH
jgi:hypothetical protein